jgi:hypothetical protein
MGELAIVLTNFLDRAIEHVLRGFDIIDTIIKWVEDFPVIGPLIRWAVYGYAAYTVGHSILGWW